MKPLAQPQPAHFGRRLPSFSEQPLPLLVAKPAGNTHAMSRTTSMNTGHLPLQSLRNARNKK